MTVLEIQVQNTFVHYPLAQSTLTVRQRRGSSCDTRVAVAYIETKQVAKSSGSRSFCLFGFAPQKENSNSRATLCGSARRRSARQRSGRSGCLNSTTFQSKDVSDVETAVPSPDASPCPSSAGSPLQTPSPSPKLHLECRGWLCHTLTGVPSICSVAPFVSQHVSGCTVPDGGGSYAALFDPSSCDQVLQTPSPVLPTWQPAWVHTAAAAFTETATCDDDDTCSNFSDDSDFFGCSCQCANSRRAHVPFASFLGSDEIDEDFCPVCCSQTSFHAPRTCSSPKLDCHNPRTVCDSPGEAFWR